MSVEHGLASGGRCFHTVLGEKGAHSWLESQNGLYSAAQGPGGDKKLIDLIEQATGVPATTCVTPMVKVFQRMDVHKAVVVCPYY